MREYLSKKLIIETLVAHRGQALTTNELATKTEIPIKTLRSQLKHLVHTGLIKRKSIMVQKFNKARTKKYEEPQVWYYAV